MRVVTAAELKGKAINILKAAGVSENDAALVADHLVEANLRGRDSHGIMRLPSIIKGIEKKSINHHPNVSIVQETPAVALLDGGRGIGQVVALQAMTLAVEKARKLGVGLVSVRNAAHIGFLGYYAEYAARQGTIGAAFTNTESAMSPPGGAQPILGTNPICIGIPSEKGPIIADLATSVVARGKILEYSRRGQKIPKGWAVDQTGADTEEPAAALEGSLLPIAGPKGYCLAFAIDILTGGLAGASVGSDVRGTLHTEDICTKGDLFIAIDPQLFTGLTDFLGKVGRLREQIEACKKAPGVDRIYLPGDPEMVTRSTRMKEGISLDDGLWQQLQSLEG